MSNRKPTLLSSNSKSDGSFEIIHPGKGAERVFSFPTGIDLLRDPYHNKGLAFTKSERQSLGLRGLLPPRVLDLESQQVKVMQIFRSLENPLDKYIYLRELADRNMTMYFRAVIDHTEEIMPIIYTPTVGAACLQYGLLYRRPHGMYISIEDKGFIRDILDNWYQPEVKIIVVTDGERILGLGDLGALGMGIPVGKLDLYTALAGIPPDQCLPLLLDVGTNNKALLEEAHYNGIKQTRAPREEYDALVDEFMAAVADKWGPQTLVQFEDFGNSNAFRVLEKYHNRYCCFNDDIQGTASVAVAGVFSAMRMMGAKLADQRFLFLGAGEAGTGIGDLLVAALVEQGVSLEDARAKCWYVDSKGLVVKSRIKELQHHKLAYAHDAEFCSSFLDAIHRLKPTAIIGVSAQPKAFDQAVIEALCQYTERPLIFALSNPTSKCEVSASDAYTWSKGKCVYASGSPYPAVTYDGRTFVPGQGNNAYIFPGVGLGVIVAGARRVTNDMFLEAARALAKYVSQEQFDKGCIYPPLSEIREVSVEVATVVAETAFRKGMAVKHCPVDLRKACYDAMYTPVYDKIQLWRERRASSTTDL